MWNPRRIPRRFIAVAAATALTALAGTTQAAAEPVPDQQQPSIGATGSVAIGGGSDQKLAQVVTTGIAGRLSSVGLAVACDGGSNLVVQIQPATTTPDGGALSTQTVTGIGPVFGTALRTVTLASPAFLPVGSQFAIVLDSSGDCGSRPGPDGESYAGGQAYFDSRPNPIGLWLCMCSFPGPFDLPFQTFVEPACGVPEVVGETLAAATELLRRHGCVLGRVSSVYSTAVPRGAVASQDATAGAVVAPGAPIGLTVSRGPRPCIVPNVRRLTLRRAKARLAQRGCTLGRVSRSYSNARRGRVVAQRPRTGARLKPRAKVDVVVSRGPRR